LEVAGFRATADGLAETDVRVAFFGDLFRPRGAMAGGEPPYTPADVKPGPERDLLKHWYEEAVEQDPSLGPPGRGDGAGQGGGTGNAAAAAALSHLRRGGPARVYRDLKQVTVFLHKPDAKEQALQRVADEVTPDTRVVVGHSLGSVVVYEFLARYSPPQVELLVTLGSPLGIPNLVFERLTPAPAGGWVLGRGGWPVG
jgi:hypothetical protein